MAWYFMFDIKKENTTEWCIFVFLKSLIDEDSC